MNYSVLVVDDSPIVRKMVCRTLGMAGFDESKILEAGNGREALELLSVSWVDIVLSDIHMPEMNGIEMLEAMAANEALRRVPVIVISTERSTKRIEHMKALGIKGYLTKPFTPEGVRDAVFSALKGTEP